MKTDDCTPFLPIDAAQSTHSHKQSLTMNSLTLRILAILMACFLAIPSASADRIKRKGRFLHTEIQGFKDRTSFDVTLHMTPKTSFPVLRFNKLTVRTIQEIKVFETVIDSINTIEGHQQIRDYRDLEVIPNEFIKDNPSTRQDIIQEGPFRNATFTINGQTMITDHQGLAVDSRQHILKLFDDLTKNSVQLTVKHAQCEPQQVTFTRLIMRPDERFLPDYKKRDPKATLDILEAMGVPSLLANNPTQCQLLIECQAPSTIAPGDVFPVTVKVTNQGNGTCGNLVLCTFSRENWLDGTLFYIGNLPGKQTSTFVRFFQAPASFKTKKSFMLVAPWDASRAQPNSSAKVLLNH